MQYFVGTSGYSYQEWKGKFYPQRLPQKKMLAYYAERFRAVEMNGTFRQMPGKAAVESWAEQAPKSFRFVLKAHQAITHRKRLTGVEDITDELIRVAAVLKKRQGPLLFQLPPNFKKDVARLERFLTFIGGRAKSAFEFRHASWFDQDVFDCLRKHACALCIADAEELPQTDFVTTAKWGYLRLRRKAYTSAQLRRWIDKLRAAKVSEAYVFFRHEDTSAGPKFAARFLKLTES